MTSPSGWQAHLYLEIEQRQNSSIVCHSRQNGPLTFQKPFYPEGPSPCHIYLLHPPAGIVGGDHLRFDVHLGNGSAALITTPGAGKFYRSPGITAELEQHFFLEKNAILEWLPQETIYYPGANAHLQTTIELDDGAKFLGWELHCLGLPVNGKDFGEGRADIGFSLFREKRPILFEHLKVTPEKKRFQQAFLRNHPVFGTFVATGADSEMLQNLRENLPETDECGTTCIEDLLILRYLGDNMLRAREIFLAVWKTLRPMITGQKPEPPRIWST